MMGTPDLRALPNAALVFAALLLLFSFFSFSIASADWISVTAILGACLGLVALSRGTYAMSLIWLAGMPTLFVFPNRFLNAIPGLTMERMMFAAIALALILSRVFRKRPAVAIHGVEKWCIAFLALALLSMLLHLPGQTRTDIKITLAMYLQGYVMPLGALFIARRIDWTSDRIEGLIRILALVGIFLTAIAILQQYFGVTLFVPQHLQQINADRASGTFGNSHEFGAVLTVLMTLTLLKAVRSPHDAAATVFYLAVTALLVIAIVLTKTRAPWIAVIVTCTILFIRDPRTRPVLVGLAAFGAIAGAIYFAVAFDPDLWRNRIADVIPIYNRLTAYATSVNAIVHNPVLGMGFTNSAFAAAKAGYLSGFGDISGYWATFVGVPHNEFLHIGLLTGIPGLAVFLVLLGKLRGLLGKFHAAADDGLARDLGLYMDVALIAYVLNACLVDFSYANYFTILLFFLFGATLQYGERRMMTGVARNPAPRGSALTNIRRESAHAGGP